MNVIELETVGSSGCSHQTKPHRSTASSRGAARTFMGILTDVSLCASPGRWRRLRSHHNTGSSATVVNVKPAPNCRWVAVSTFDFIPRVFGPVSSTRPWSSGMIYVPRLSALTRVLFIKSLYSCSAQTNGQHLIKAVTVFTEVTVGVVVVRNAAKIYIRERRGWRRGRRRGGGEFWPSMLPY